MVDSLIEWHVVQLTLKGQEKSGDHCLVKPFETSVLVAVVDGLGHGEEAAAAAKIAVDVLEANARDDVIALFKRSHEALRGSRGVVMSVALLNGLEGTMTWMGVGNVEGLLARANPDIKPQKESLLIRAGVLGGPLAILDASIIPIMPEIRLSSRLTASAVASTKKSTRTIRRKKLLGILCPSTRKTATMPWYWSRATGEFDCESSLA